MDIESSCIKTKLFTETVAEEILTVVLNENDFEYQNQPNQCSFCGPSCFLCIEPNAIKKDYICIKNVE